MNNDWETETRGQRLHVEYQIKCLIYTWSTANGKILKVYRSLLLLQYWVYWEVFLGAFVKFWFDFKFSERNKQIRFIEMLEGSGAGWQIIKAVKLTPGDTRGKNLCFLTVVTQLHSQHPQPELRQIYDGDDYLAWRRVTAGERGGERGGITLCGLVKILSSLSSAGQNTRDKVFF